MNAPRTIFLIGLALAAAAASGPSLVQDPPPPPAEPIVLEDQPITYTLREGDTLESIAEKWYGSRDFASAIGEANPGLD